MTPNELKHYLKKVRDPGQEITTQETTQILIEYKILPENTNQQQQVI